MVNKKFIPAEQLKLVIFCPLAFKDTLLENLKKHGITEGSWVEGTTTYTPTVDATPTTGEAEHISVEPEGKYTIFITNQLLPIVKETVCALHPYESFAFEVYATEKKNNTVYEKKVKLSTTTYQPENAMQVLSKLGAGVIGPYKDCFFWYKDGQQWNVETLCDSSKLTKETVKRGYVEINDVVIKIEELLEDPVAFGRRGAS